MILCDTHADTLHRRSVHPGAAYDITLSGARSGGVSVQTMAFFVGDSPALPDVARIFARMEQEAETLRREGWKQITDFRDAREGETAFLLSVEGCDLLDGDLSMLTSWREKGIRMAALTWKGSVTFSSRTRPTVTAVRAAGEPVDASTAAPQAVTVCWAQGGFWAPYSLG